MPNYILLSDPYNLEFEISVKVNEEIELLFDINRVKWDEYGDKLWFQYGELHRLDGPAVVWGDGYESYYIEGKWLTKEEFMRRTNVKPCPTK